MTMTSGASAATWRPCATIPVFGQRGAGGLELFGDVVEGHARLLGEVVGDDLPGDGIERALPRHEDEVAALHALCDRRLPALREPRLRRRLREDDFWFHADPPLSLRTTSSGIGLADSRAPGSGDRVTQARTSKPVAQSRSPTGIVCSMRNVVALTHATAERMVSTSP